MRVSQNNEPRKQPQQKNEAGSGEIEEGIPCTTDVAEAFVPVGVVLPARDDHGEILRVVHQVHPVRSGP